jgi:hypothetical protein
MKKHLTLLTTSLFTFFVSFAQPVIQSFSPASGAVNTPVIITGTGFSTVASDNIVYFGAIKATVTASTATTITTTVPAGATYQPITVTTNKLTAYSALPFLVSGGGSGAGLPFIGTSFVPKQDLTTGIYPHGVALADFNLDGKSDLLVSKGSSSTVSVLTNTSSGSTVSFAPGLELAAAGNDHEVPATGDLDGDGKLDFVVPNTFGAVSLSVFRNTTTGPAITFASRLDLPVVSNPYSVAIGDLDGDGKPDLVAVNSGTGTDLVSVFRNTSTPGNLSFASRVDLSGGQGPFSVVIADLDADGKSEIIVTGQYSSSSHLSVLKNNSSVGNISFAAPALLSNVSGPFTVAVGDLNGDGKPDLVAASAFTNSIVVKRNTSTSGVPGFSSTLDYFTTGSYPEGVSITDFDGDGKPDVVATNNQGNSVSVLRNISSGGGISFAGHVDYTVGASPNYVTCGDLDGDGRAEIITANTSSDYVSVLKNIIGANVAPAITSFTPGTGANGTTVTITGSNFNWTTAVKFGGVNATSFTINSNTSITAIVGPGASGDVSVTTQYGTAVLAGFVFNGPIINSFTPTLGETGSTIGITGENFLGATSVKFGGVEAASFTINSATSIFAVVANGANGDVTVTTPNGTATRPGFSFNVPAITSFSPAMAPVGATVTITGKNFGPNVSDNTVFFGAVKATVSTSSTTQLTVVVPAGATYAPITVTTGRRTAYSSLPFSTTFTTTNPQLTTASFTPAGNFPTGTYPWAIYINDLNDDGKPELITANSVGNNISILKNASSIGSISFDSKLDLTVGQDPKKIAIGDLDGDGKPDLAVVNSNNSVQNFIGTVSVFRNTSTGGTLSFSPKIDITTGNSSYDIAMGDINSDGKPDLVVTNGNSGFFSILINTTVGSTLSFAPRQDIPVSYHADNIAVADFDKDGKVDIIASNFSDYNIAVFRNHPVYGILSSYNQSVGTYANDMSTGDLDGDGQLDLLVTIDGAFAFLENTSTPGFINLSTPRNFNMAARSTNVGDLNGDGKPDVGVGQWLTGKISILQNTSATPGNLSLATNVDFTTGTYDTYVAIGDLDGDGKPEIVSANTIENTATVLRNTIDNPIVVTQISPTTARKGDVVSITGSDFTNASVVRFGGTAAKSFTIVSPTRIDAVVDGGASGNVSVTTPQGTGSWYGFNFTPEIAANGATSICKNSAVTLTSTAFANNQWYKNGALIAGATGTSYQANAAGIYSVRVTSGGITTTSPTTISVSVTTVPTPTITLNGGVLTSSAATGNQWYFYGTQIANATGNTFQPSANGEYTVKVTANGCTSDFSAVYNYAITATVDLGNGKTIKLWPNPVRSILTLQWDIANLQTVSVQITDMYGMPVLYKQGITSGGTINTAALPAGTYFVKMYGAGKKPVGTVKMLKVD